MSENCFFWPFLTKDKAIPSHFYGKIWPRSTQVWSGFFLLLYFGTHTLYKVKIIIITIRSIGDHDDCESRGDDVENVVTRLLGQLCPTAMEFSEVKPFDRQKLFTLSCWQLVFSSFLLSYASPIIESKRCLFLIVQESARTQAQNAYWPYLFN